MSLLYSAGNGRRTVVGPCASGNTRLPWSGLDLFDRLDVNLLHVDAGRLREGVDQRAGDVLRSKRIQLFAPFALRLRVDVEAPLRPDGSRFDDGDADALRTKLLADGIAEADDRPLGGVVDRPAGHAVETTHTRHRGDHGPRASPQQGDGGVGTAQNSIEVGVD